MHSAGPVPGAFAAVGACTRLTNLLRAPGLHHAVTLLLRSACMLTVVLFASQQRLLVALQRFLLCVCEWQQCELSLAHAAHAVPSLIAALLIINAPLLVHLRGTCLSSCLVCVPAEERVCVPCLPHALARFLPHRQVGSHDSLRANLYGRNLQPPQRMIVSTGMLLQCGPQPLGYYRGAYLSCNNVPIAPFCSLSRVKPTSD